MWTQVYQGFGLKEVEDERSEEEEDEEDLPEGSVDRFKHEVLPLSTAREKRLRDQKERMDDDPASQYDSVQPDPRKPLKRFSTFMGGDVLETTTKENKRRLLRRPPYRTISTDAQQLDFVSPSDALFDDPSSLRPHRHLHRENKGGEEKVKRLPPGKTPRIPYLNNLDQTGFAIQVNQPEGPDLYKVTDLRVSDHEAVRLAKQGNGWVSTKRKKRNKFSSKKARLQMVTEEEAIDTAKIDPPYTSSESLWSIWADSSRSEQIPRRTDQSEEEISQVSAQETSRQSRTPLHPSQITSSYSKFRSSTSSSPRS